LFIEVAGAEDLVADGPIGARDHIVPGAALRSVAARRVDFRQRGPLGLISRSDVIEEAIRLAWEADRRRR
jgi:hypothetical protein